MRIIGADMVADTVYRFIVALMTCFAALTSATDAQPVSYDDISYSMGTFFGNARNDAYLLHVAVDSAGYIYGTGLCTDIPTTTGVYQRTRTGMFDVMVFKLDPTMKRLIWATYIGGTNNDAGGSIAVNRNGEVYVTGYTYSSNFPTSVASDAAYLANNVVNYFALKLSNDGSRIMYSRILGNGVVASVQTASASKGAHLALNPQGEAFVFGHTLTPSTYSVSPAAFQRTNAGLQDLVLTKLDTTGGIVSSTFLGGVRSESAGDICYAQGKLYFSGTIASSGLSISAGKTPDAGDCFVGVFDDAPSIIPRRLYIYGSSGTDAGIAVSYDNISHRVCATGTSAAGSFPYTRILQPGMTSGGFIASLDSGLTRLNYCALIGANSVPTSIIPRKNGSVYVAGYTNGVLPITANALQSVNRGGLDGMMLCLDSIGQNVRYCTYIGGSSSDYSAAKVLLFEQSCVLRVIFGITSHSSNFPTTADSYQPLKLNGGDDQPVLALFSTVTDISASIQVKPCTREATLRVSMPCAPLDVIWNFGDGSPVRRGGVTQSYTYPRSGTFTATITLVYPDPDSVILRRVVTVDPAPQVDAGSNLIICKKNSGVRLTATGAIQYLWSPGRFLNDSTVPNPIATPPQTTTFYVRGLHNGGCVSYDSVIVQVRDIVARAERDTAVCEGVSVTLRASGAADVWWTPTTGLNVPYGQTVVATPRQTTTYRALVSDGICSDTANVTVTVYPMPKLRLNAPQSLCDNSSAQITAVVTLPQPNDSSGMVVEWKSSENISNTSILTPTITPSKTAWYVCTVRTRNGCTVRDSIRVVVQQKLQLSLQADTLLCSGESTQLLVSGGQTYYWSPADGLSSTTIASPICRPESTTTYTIISRNGVCADTQRITIHVHPIPGVTALGDTTVCQNEDVTLSVMNPDTALLYTWYPAKNFTVNTGSRVTARSNEAVRCYVVATSTFGCVASDTVDVRIDNALTVAAAQGIELCPGESGDLDIAILGDSLTTYSWYPIDGTFNTKTGRYTVLPQKSGWYTVTARRGACVGIDSAYVRIKPLPSFTMMNDTAVCKGTSLQLHVSGYDNETTFQWLRNGQPDSLLDNATSPTPVTRSISDNVVFTVTGVKNGCSTQQSMKLITRELPTIFSQPDYLICRNESIQMSIESPTMKTVHWSPPYGLNVTDKPNVIASPEDTTVYTVTVTDEFGCVKSADVTVNVKPRIPVSFTLGAISARAGQDTSIVITAWSSKEIITPIACTVFCDSDMFDVTDSTLNTIDNGQRKISVRLGETSLGTTPKEIARIRGKILLSTKTSSIVTISDASVHEVYCPTIETKPTVLQVTDCFYQQKAIRINNPLVVNVMPNPVGELMSLSVSAPALELLTFVIYNSIGEKVLTWETQPHQVHFTMQTDVSLLASGTYSLVVTAAYQSQTIPFVKHR